VVFIILLIATTLLIAGSAASFSVYGLASIFSGIFWPVIVMGVSLEAGKLIAVSFAYRYWTIISNWIKTYLVVAVLVLMVITSMGIFGILAQGYQSDILPIKLKQQQIELITAQIEDLKRLKQEHIERKKQLDNDIVSLPKDFITARQRLMNSYGPELKLLQESITKYTEQIHQKTLKVNKIKAENLEQQVHIGPIVFIASVFNQDVDQATKWLILIIIFVFDPLAVILTIGANIAILNRVQIKRQIVNKTSIVKGVDNLARNANEVKVQLTADIAADQIRRALREFENRQLTPLEIVQKQLLEEMLRKKEIKEKIRRG